jgi:hypothetical protein
MAKITRHKSRQGYFYYHQSGRGTTPTQAEYEAQENSALKRFCIFSAIICAILGLILLSIKFF